jgi:hypothetical protein
MKTKTATEYQIKIDVPEWAADNAKAYVVMCGEKIAGDLRTQFPESGIRIFQRADGVYTETPEPVDGTYEEVPFTASSNG